MSCSNHVMDLIGLFVKSLQKYPKHCIAPLIYNLELVKQLIVVNYSYDTIT